MTRIYTRSGDQGSTGLADGTRIAKTDPRIEAIGSVDECNAQLGLLISLLENRILAEPSPADQTLVADLLLVQHQLFDLGAMLAGTPASLISARHIAALERRIDKLDEALPPLRQFVLPGGSIAAAQAHIVRTVCRRAERSTFVVAQTGSAPAAAMQFLNRLSDYLFLVARTLSATGKGDVNWLPEEQRSV